MAGVTPAADMLLSDGLSDLARVIERESDHENIQVRSHWDHASDQYVVECRCGACDKSWTIKWNGTALKAKRAHDDLISFFRNDVIPFFQRITKAACYSLKEGALLAEWITERLSQVGPVGLPYPQLIHEASEARLAPPQDVDGMLRKLGFLNEWVPVGPIIPDRVIRELSYDPRWRLPIVRLPLEHPRCTWKEEDIRGHEKAEGEDLGDVSVSEPVQEGG